MDRRANVDVIKEKHKRKTNISHTKERQKKSLNAKDVEMKMHHGAVQHFTNNAKCVKKK